MYAQTSTVTLTLLLSNPVWRWDSVVATLLSPTQKAQKTVEHKKHKHGSGKKEKAEQLEKLRRERVRREEAEKAKSEALLKQHYGLEESSKAESSDAELPKRRK